MPNKDWFKELFINEAKAALESNKSFVGGTVDPDAVKPTVENGIMRFEPAKALEE